MRAIAVSGDAPVYICSALNDAALGWLAAYIRTGRTVAFVGSSGVGKSTLVNRLPGQEIQATRESRAADSRGRHTTVTRELFLAPGLILDTPGMRELQLWDVDHDENSNVARREFAEIRALAEQCQFNDCRHEQEPGCAVRAALESGELEERRYRSFIKLNRELEYNQSQQNERSRRDRKEREKALHQKYRRIQNEHRAKRRENP